MDSTLKKPLFAWLVLVVFCLGLLIGNNLFDEQGWYKENLLEWLSQHFELFVGVGGLLVGVFGAVLAYRSDKRYFEEVKKQNTEYKKKDKRLKAKKQITNTLGLAAHYFTLYVFMKVGTSNSQDIDSDSQSEELMQQREVFENEVNSNGQSYVDAVKSIRNLIEEFKQVHSEGDVYIDRVQMILWSLNLYFDNVKLNQFTKFDPRNIKALFGSSDEYFLKKFFDFNRDTRIIRIPTGNELCMQIEDVLRPLEVCD